MMIKIHPYRLKNIVLRVQGKHFFLIFADENLADLIGES